MQQQQQILICLTCPGYYDRNSLMHSHGGKSHVGPAFNTCNINLTLPYLGVWNKNIDQSAKYHDKGQ